MNNLERFMKSAVIKLFAATLVAFASSTVTAQDAGMLYLVEFEATDAGAPETPEQAVTLLEQLIVPSLESLAKEGRIRSGGLRVGARAGVFIVYAKSHDEVTTLVRTIPAWGVWNWEVTPLESFSHRVGLEKKMIQTLRAAK